MEQDDRRRTELLLLLPFADQLLALAVVSAIAPLVLGLYLLRNGHYVGALAVIGAWTPVVLLLARTLHRRKIARYPVVVGGVVVVVTLGALAMWAL